MDRKSAIRKYFQAVQDEMTPVERSMAAKKAWVTRHANGEVAKNKYETPNGHMMHSFANGPAVNPNAPAPNYPKGKIWRYGEPDIRERSVAVQTKPGEIELYSRESYAQKMAKKRMELGQRHNQAMADYALASGTPAAHNAEVAKNRAQEALAEHQGRIGEHQTPEDRENMAAAGALKWIKRKVRSMHNRGQDTSGWDVD